MVDKENAVNSFSADCWECLAHLLFSVYLVISTSWITTEQLQRKTLVIWWWDKSWGTTSSEHIYYHTYL